MGFLDGFPNEYLPSAPLADSQKQERTLLDCPLQGQKATCPWVCQPPLMPGSEIDLLHDMLKAVLSAEDFAEYRVLRLIVRHAPM